MSAVTPYTRPPIVEAVLDIQAELPAGISLADLERCQRKIKKAYPTQKAVQHFSGEVTLGASVTTTTSSEFSGHVFSSFDGKQLFQAKRTGFTYNRLAPYPGWAAFIREAQRLWEEYRRVVRPIRVTRLALRYINRFDIPLPTVKLEDYFRTYLEVARDLPQELAGFFFQLQLSLPEAKATVIITKTVVKPVSPSTTSVLFDLDLYRTDEIPPSLDIWPLFEDLRLCKNRVFEACITDHCRELIR